MTDVLSLDALRTPHGKSKKADSLHEVAPIHLLQSLYNTWASTT